MNLIGLDLAYSVPQAQHSLVHIKSWVLFCWFPLSCVHLLFALLPTDVYNIEWTFFLILWFVILLNNT